MTGKFDRRIEWDKYFNAVETCKTMRPEGRITKVVGLIAEGDGMGLGIGSLCAIRNDYNREIKAEVIGFRDDKVLLMPYGDLRGISPGSRIIPLEDTPAVAVGDAFLGRVIDGMGAPLDGKGKIPFTHKYPLYGNPINPMERKTIKEPLDVGICAINTMIPLGRGQRVAIMAGSGVGKSVLMGMMTKHTTADVIILGLIGERGREVKDFVSDTLGKEGMERSVVVAATSDSPPLVRMRGAYLATTLAEYFRDQGKNVLLIMDSITRYAMSSRDVGLAAGEPPTSRGYTPSFFVQIPVLLERAGYIEGGGSITGIYTVLVEGDDMNDPVGDTVRSIVDGHIVLSRDLANKGHYPAIDVLASVSRVMRDVSQPEHMELRKRAVDVIAAHRGAEDMISIGAYVDGSDARIDEAKRLMPKIDGFLRQDMHRRVSIEMGLGELRRIFAPQPEPGARR
ncbi:FliI [Desulforapulum autotrophicum HRM2]|uniref:Flagellum-specific ATP synthase n=2 Tax=Desulforapulum autotrophicum TaxID=2296 RepID=C0QAK1_DESAH|nr:FliI [Desulforapulum autotrophicum HRM2]